MANNPVFRVSAIIILFCVVFVSTVEGRELLGVLHFEESLLLSALPKGLPPPSAPSKKGHMKIDDINQKLVAMINGNKVNRFTLYSVPSPGVGN